MMHTASRWEYGIQHYKRWTGKRNRWGELGTTALPCAEPSSFYETTKHRYAEPLKFYEGLKHRCAEPLKNYETIKQCYTEPLKNYEAFAHCSGGRTKTDFINRSLFRK